MLFKNITLVDENYDIQKHMNIITKENKIAYIGRDIPSDYSGDVFDGNNKVAIPGLFNTHCHIPMTVLRGYGEGLPLHRWLHEKMFPFEARLNGEDCYFAGMLGAMELIKSGAVSFTDMYFNILDIARAVKDSGLKANICHGVSVNGDTRYKDLKGYRDTESLYSFVKQDTTDRIKVDAGLHAEYTSDEALIRDVADYAKSMNMIIQTHISETRKEHEECKLRHGMTPVAYLERHGLLDQPLVAAHCVWVEGDDFDILRDKGVTVAHCMSSNLKLGSGFAPVKRMIDNGIKVSIGTDGASSNNNLNMLEEINLSAIANKGITNDPEFMTPKQILRLATLNGAMAQGREDCGSIKIGNRADIVVFDFDKPHLQPVHDILSNIIFSAEASDICLSMIDGEVVYKDGYFTNIDTERVIYEVNRTSKRILSEL